MNGQVGSVAKEWEMKSLDNDTEKESQMVGLNGRFKIFIGKCQTDTVKVSGAVSDEDFWLKIAVHECSQQHRSQQAECGATSMPIRWRVDKQMCKVETLQ